MIGVRWFIEPRWLNGKPLYALVGYGVVDGETGWTTGKELDYFESIDAAKAAFQHLHAPALELFPPSIPAKET